MTRPKHVSENARLFGKNLAEAMRKAQMTVRRLAELTGLSTETIYSYKNGSREPTLSQIVLIKYALGCPFFDLLWNLRPTQKPKRVPAKF